MPNGLLSLVLRGLIGFAIGVLLWTSLREPYHALLASMARPMLRQVDTAVTWVRPVGEKIVTDRSDLPAGQNVKIDARLFTFNTILLFTLFATNPRPLSRRNLGWLLFSMLILTLTHAIAVVAGTESVFSRSFGEWSDTHYSALATDVSLIIAQGYMLVGGYAVAFGLWWATRSAPELPRTTRPEAASATRASRGSGRGR
ncbi:MAG: hypothetical protein ABI837_16920 [Acidobacteriota bacterium]